MGAVLASRAAASCWRGHLLTVRSTALLVLSGCVVGDEGLVLLVCLTFVCLVQGVLGRGEEGAGVVDIGVVVRFWNKCHRLLKHIDDCDRMGLVALLWNQRPEIPSIIITCMQDIQGGEKLRSHPCLYLINLNFY